MTSLLQTLKSRFDNRPDSEHGQALPRVAMLVVVLAYLQFVIKGHAGVERGPALSLSFLALEYVVSIGILVWIEDIRRAHVCTPVTNAHLVSPFLHENKKHKKYK